MSSWIGFHSSASLCGHGVPKNTSWNRWISLPKTNSGTSVYSKYTITKFKCISRNYRKSLAIHFVTHRKIKIKSTTWIRYNIKALYLWRGSPFLSNLKLSFPLNGVDKILSNWFLCWFFASISKLSCLFSILNRKKNLN